MEKNIGIIDKKIRLFVALILVISGFYFGIWWLYLIALVPIGTALIGNCPLYSIFKINSCKKK